MPRQDFGDASFPRRSKPGVPEWLGHAELRLSRCDMVRNGAGSKRSEQVATILSEDFTDGKLLEGVRFSNPFLRRNHGGTEVTEMQAGPLSQ
jgi:hypothetical protein